MDGLYYNSVWLWCGNQYLTLKKFDGEPTTSFQIAFTVFYQQKNLKFIWKAFGKVRWKKQQQMSLIEFAAGVVLILYIFFPSYNFINKLTNRFTVVAFAYNYEALTSYNIYIFFPLFGLITLFIDNFLFQ